MCPANKRVFRLLVTHSSSSNMLTVEAVASLNVDGLRLELRSRGAPTVGKKPELVNRLISLLQGSDGHEDAVTGEADAPKDGLDNGLVEDAPAVVPEPIQPELPQSVAADDGRVEDVTVDYEHDSPAEGDSREAAASAELSSDVAVLPAPEGEPAPLPAAEDAQASAVAPTEPEPMEISPAAAATDEAMDTETASAAADAETVAPEEAAEQMRSLKERLKESMLRKKAADLEAIATPHVRVDNFQRPLNVKILLKWLSDLLGFEVLEQSLWLHPIKTHGYISFGSTVQATACIERISGKRYPASSTANLVANYTSVSALEAAEHPEARLKPGEWKSAAPQAAAVVQEAAQSNSSSSNGNGSSAIGNGKRKMAEVDADGNLFRRTVAQGQGQAQVDGAAVEDSKKRRVDPQQQQQQQQQQAKPAAKPRPEPEKVRLEDLFRKTKTSPQIYWQPVAESTVEHRRRLRERLASAGAGNSTEGGRGSDEQVSVTA